MCSLSQPIHPPDDGCLVSSRNATAKWRRGRPEQSGQPLCTSLHSYRQGAGVERALALATLGDAVFLVCLAAWTSRDARIRVLLTNGSGK